MVFTPYVEPGAKRLFRYKVISADKLIDYIGADLYGLILT